MLSDAESKLESFRKEKEYLENQLSFTNQNLFEKEGHEILEEFTDEEDKAWREKHRENVKKSIMMKTKEKKKHTEEITDEELWNRLEELELEEELENELLDNYNEIEDKRKDNSFLVNEEQVLLTSFRDEQSKKHEELNLSKVPDNSGTKPVIDETNISLKDKKVTKASDTTTSTSKLDLLQEVLDKQNQLENKLLELKNRDRQPSKTEKDLMARLDEMEQLDELEDEMERLDDVLDAEDIESNDDDENIVKTTPTKLQKSISFADEAEDTSETIELTFKHNDVEPNNDPYNTEIGITKPSDIYDAHSHLFNIKPTSILKKSKYNSDHNKQINVEDNYDKEITITQDESVISSINSTDVEVYPVKKTIVVNDVTENSSNHRSKIDADVRPTSLFKKRRMQNKS